MNTIKAILLTITYFGFQVNSENQFGLKIPGSRIIGGREVYPANKYPWLVSLDLLGRHQCGGMTYKPSKIITAAHCTVFDLEDWTVSFRVPDLKIPSTGKVFNIVKRVKHPQYDKNKFDLNDVAVWTIDGQFDLLPHEYVAIDDGTYASRKNLMLKVAGWGKLTSKGAMSNKLMETPLPIFDTQKCVKALNSVEKIVDKNAMLCAGFPEGGKDACQGDSGGPLFTYNENQPLIVGLVSWGHGCAYKGFPGVFTRLHKFTKFIDSNS